MNKIKERNTEAVEANAIEGQTTGKPILDALLNTSESFADDEYECVFITNWPFDDKCYQCGKTRAEHYKRSPAVNVAPSSAIPEDAEASLTEWLDEVERNQRENEREVEEQAWRDQELLQEETDNT